MGKPAVKTKPRELTARSRAANLAKVAKPPAGVTPIAAKARRARKLRVAMHEDAGRTPRPLRRIVVCTDFSPSTDAALAAVVAAAAGQPTLIELVYVVDVFTEMFMLGTMRPPRGPEVAGRDIHAALTARVRAARAGGARCISTILVGLPGLALLNHADRTDAEVLVMGLEPAAAPRAADGGRPRRAGKATPSSWVATAAQRVLRTTGWRRPSSAAASSPALSILREIS